MTISVDEPVRSTRPWPDAGPEGLIVVGGGHEVGADVDTEGRYADLEQWTRETFEVAEVSHRWSAHDYVTPDRVPYVGRSPLHQHVHVATGFGKWGCPTAARLVSCSATCSPAASRPGCRSSTRAAPTACDRCQPSSPATSRSPRSW